MAEAKPLRLLAETAEDLQVISAAVQDAVTKVANIKYDVRAHRFLVELNRFRWEGETGRANERERVRSILAFDGVLGVRSRGLTRSDPEMVISLLQATFEPAEAPGGTIVLTLAGDGEVVLEVEVLDATLLDSDYVWPTRHVPSHERRRR